MRSIVRSAVLIVGTVVCGPALTGAPSLVAEPEVRASVTDDRRAPMCILCWVR